MRLEGRCPLCESVIEIPALFAKEPGRPFISCPHCEGTYLFDFTGLDPVGTEAAAKFAQEVNISGYRLIGILSPGSMGYVYTAIRESTGEVCAVKVMTPRIAEFRPLVERFQREVQTMRALRHPNVMPVLEAQTSGDTPFFSMPFVPGRTARARLRQYGRLPLAEVLALLAPVAEGLDHIHRCGYLHRDVKPANILITMKGEAILLDFGIAMQRGMESSLTEEGAAVGTPAYNAPEVFERSESTAHSDQYSLAVVVYQMLVGALPMGVFNMPRYYNESIPEESEAALIKGLRHNPRDRHDSVKQFARSFARPLLNYMQEGRSAAEILAEAARLDEETLSLKPRFVTVDAERTKSAGLARFFAWINLGR